MTHEQSVTDLTNVEMLDFISFAIQEAMSGNTYELDSALWCVEHMREETDK